MSKPQKNTGQATEPRSEARLDMLYQATQALNTAQSYTDLLSVFHQHTCIGRQAFRLRLNYCSTLLPVEDDLVQVTPLADWPENEPPLANTPSTLQALVKLLDGNRPTIIERLSDHPQLPDDLKTTYQAAGLVSLTLLPLHVGQNRIGFMELFQPTPLDPAQCDTQSLMILSGYAAAIMQNIFHRLANSQLAERLASLRQMSEQLNHAQTKDEVYAITARQTAQIIEAERVSVALLDDDGLTFSVLGLQGDAGPIPMGSQLPLDNSAVQNCVNQATVVNLPHLHRSSLTEARKLAQAGLMSALNAPLRVGGRIIGTLNVASKRPAAYAPHDEGMLSQIASLLSSALENRRLLEQVKTSLAQTEMLYEANRALITRPTRLQALRVISRPGVATGAAAATLFDVIVDDAGRPEWLEVSLTLGREDVHTFVVGQRYYVPELSLANYLTNDQTAPLLISDVATYEGLDDQTLEVLFQNQVASLVIIPLTVARRWVGLVILDWTDPCHFTTADEHIYRALTGQAATIIENQHLFEQTQETLTETRILYQASQVLNNITDLQADLAGLVACLQENNLALNLSQVLLYAIDVNSAGKPERPEVVAYWGAEDRLAVSPDQRDYLLDRPEIGLWTAKQDLLLIGDVSTDDRLTEAQRSLYHEVGIHASLLMPLHHGERWIGMFILNWAQAQTFSSLERRVYQGLQQQLAATLENHRLTLRTRQALALTESLFEAGRRLSEAGDDLQEVIAAVVEGVPVHSINRAVLALFEYDAQNELEGVRIVANWHNGQGPKPSPIGRRYLRGTFTLVDLMLTPAPLFFDDTLADQRVDPQLRQIFEEQNIRAMVVLPLQMVERQLGVMVLEAPEVIHFTDQQIQPYLSLVRQMAAAIENRQLLAQAQNRIRREQVLREITAQVRATTNPQTIVQTALAELGAALNRPVFARLGSAEQLMSRLVDDNGHRPQPPRAGQHSEGGE